MGLGQYDLLKNIQPADTTNLNILNVDVLDAKRINTLKDKIDLGEVISYEKKFTLTTTDMYTMQAAICAGSPDLVEQYAGVTYETDIDVYELAFWCNDARAAGNFVQMGATLYIPQNIVSGGISSYAQDGAYLEYTNNTPRKWLENYVTGEIGLDALLAYPGTKFDGYIQAAAGIITVVADIPSFGLTSGRTPGNDRESRIYPDVGALLATKNLIIKNPDGIFDGFIKYTDPLATIPVILEGYGQGSNGNVSRASYLWANLIQYKLQPVFALNASTSIPTASVYIAGGSYHKVVNGDYLNNAEYVNSNILSLVISAYGTPSTNTLEMSINGGNNISNPNGIYEILARLNSLYSPKDVNTLSVEPATYMLEVFLNYAINNLIYENDADPTTLVLPWVEFDAANNNEYLPFTVDDVIQYPNLLSGNPLYFNFRYLGSLAYFTPQVSGNTHDYTAVTLAFKGNAIGNLNVIDIHNKNSYGVRVNGINGTNYSTDQVTTPDLVPTYFKSFLTGSQIVQADNLFWGKFTGPSDNSIPTNSQWKINKNSSTKFGQSVAPMALNRNALTRFEEHLDYPTDVASVDEMITNITSNGRGPGPVTKSMEYQLDTTGKTYSNDIAFQFYYNSISYKIQKSLSYNVTYNGRTSDGADYSIIVPPNYNGTVFIWSHGYRYPINVEVGTTIQYPEVVSVPEPIPFASTADYLLDRGYAMMGSGFIDQGWIVDAAVKTNVELIGIFKNKFPNTRKVIAWGASEGGYITTALREQYPNLIDAAGIMNQAAIAIDSELISAGNFVYFLKIFFDNKLIFDMPTENDARLNMNYVFAIISKMAAGIAKVATQDPTFVASDWSQWGFTKPAGLPPNINPGQALLLSGILAGVPIQSPNFDQDVFPFGSAPQLLQTLWISLKRTFSIIENGSLAAALAILALYDVNKQCGGVVFGNTDLVYSTYYTSEMNTIMEDAVIPGQPVDYSAVLSFIDNNPKIVSVPSAVSKVQKLYRLKGTVNRVPSIAMEALYDPVTPASLNQKYINLFNSNLRSPSDINKYFATVWYLPPNSYSGAIPLTLKPGTLTDYYNGKNYNTQLTAPVGTNHCNYVPDQLNAWAEALILVSETGVITSEVNELMRKMRFNENDFTTIDNPSYEAPLPPIPAYYFPIVVPPPLVP